MQPKICVFRRYLPVRSVRERLCACLLIAFVGSAVSLFCGASADAQTAPDQVRRATVLPAVRAATDCITAGVAKQIGITGQTPNNALIPAIQRTVDTGDCNEHLRKMVSDYERAFGPGTGKAFYSGPYASDLVRAVRSRLAAAPQNVSQNPIEPRPAPSIDQRVIPPVQPSQVAPVVQERSAVQVPQVVRAPSTNSTPASPKTPAEIESERAFRLLIGNITGIFALAVLSTLFLFFVGLGSRWVVFTHPKDLGWTACIVIAPVATMIALALEIWRLSITDDSINHAPLYNVITGHWTTMAILVIGALVFVWGVFWTFFSSIMCNGWIVGVVLAILKISAILLLSISLIGTIYLGDGKSEHRQRQPNLLMWLVFGAIIWFASKLINGHRVAERRERLQAQTFHEIETA